MNSFMISYFSLIYKKKIQVGNGQEKVNQKEIPTLKPEVGKTKLTIRYLYLETYRKPSELLFPK